MNENLSVLSVNYSGNLPEIFPVGEEKYLISLTHIPTKREFTVIIGKGEKSQPGPYQRIARMEGQEDLIYVFEAEIFKRLKVSEGNTKEETTAINIMLTELDSDFGKLLKIL